MSEINNNYIELVLPVLPLRGIMGFPAVQMNIEIARPSSLKAFTAAATLHDAKMLLVAQKELLCICKDREVKGELVLLTLYESNHREGYAVSSILCVERN